MSALLACGTGLDEGGAYPMPVATWRFDYNSAADGEQWFRFDRCSLGRWEIETGHVVQSSSCANEQNPVPETRLGSMLMTDDVEFNDGWLVALVYSGAARRHGLVYGPTIHDLIRVSVDSAARQVSLELIYAPAIGGTGAPLLLPRAELLAEALDLELPYRRWYWLAVRRIGDLHEVWIDHVKVLEATMPWPETAIVGLYSYRNVEYRVDWLAHFPLGHTPWEPLP